MASLEDRVRKYLQCCNPAISGDHGHNTLYRAACALVNGYGLDPEIAYPFLAEFNTRCEPPWSEYDLRRKLAQALSDPNHTKPRGHLLGAEAAEPITQAGQLPKPEPVWPQPDLEAIKEIVTGGATLYDLIEKSSLRFEDHRSHAEEIIDVLFPGNPLLCCAKSSEKFATRRREAWRGKLGTLPLMVPNPMLRVLGITQDGRWSEHTKDATSRPVYQIIEFDFSEKDRSGNDTILAPLVRRWQQSGITVTDACAALILHLAERLPTLASVCFSGGKSLHAWFRVLELNRAQRRQFMRGAVSLGADKATWNPAQFVRIPDGLRASGVRQTAYYLNPAEAVHE
jgi:hypothetical protein